MIRIEYYQKAFYLLIKVTVEEVLKKPYEIEFICEAEENVPYEEKKNLLLL